MGLTLTLYTSSADPKVLDKTNSLTTLTSTSLTLNPTDTVDILNPELIIGYDQSYLACNYMKINEFGNRYYFAKVTTMPGGRIIINGTVDPLMSYKDSIKNCPACILRRQGNPTYVIDTKLPIDQNRFFTQGIVWNRDVFPTPTSSTLNYLLITNGGFTT